MVTALHPTLLSRLVREGRWTIEETCAAFERTARELGEDVTLSIRQLRRWMDGKVGRPRQAAQRVAEAFWGYPFETLVGPVEAMSQALAAPAQDRLLSRSVSHLTRGDLEDSVVDRRAFFSASLAVGAGAAFPASLLASGYGAMTAGDWLAVAFEYGHAYPTRSKSQLLVELGHDLAALLRVIESAPDGPRRADLCEAAGRLAGILGMACTDAGHPREARHAWLLGRRYAHASGSAELCLWTRGQEAIAGFYASRPPAVILSLTDEALATIEGGEGGNRSVGHGLLLAARAQALALLGDKLGAIKCLDAMAMTRSTSTDAAPVFSWGDRHVLHSRSFVYSTAGPLNEAERAQDLAVQAYRPDQTLGRAQVEMHRALSIIRCGDVRAGVDHAADVVQMNAPGRYLLAIADYVLTSVRAEDRRLPAVRQYAEILTNVRAGAP
ncbi:hypothetical protein ABNF97_00945 [Plantactinospora sp. B6F1]|uniref:hypothetical protein n=1 Tax=Plantactinospora sp. B6F1 TaxID=3158971 RepID=UPI0013EF4870